MEFHVFDRKNEVLSKCNLITHLSLLRLLFCGYSYYRDLVWTQYFFNNENENENEKQTNKIHHG